MKFLDRLIMKLFALIIGVFTIMIVLAVTGVIPMETITDLFVYSLFFLQKWHWVF